MVNLTKIKNKHIISWIELFKQILLSEENIMMEQSKNWETALQFTLEHPNERFRSFSFNEGLPKNPDQNCVYEIISSEGNRYLAKLSLLGPQTAEDLRWKTLEIWTGRKYQYFLAVFSKEVIAGWKKQS